MSDSRTNSPYEQLGPTLTMRSEERTFKSCVCWVCLNLSVKYGVIQNIACQFWKYPINLQTHINSWIQISARMADISSPKSLQLKQTDENLQVQCRSDSAQTKVTPFLAFHNTWKIISYMLRNIAEIHVCGLTVLYPEAAVSPGAPASSFPPPPSARCSAPDDNITVTPSAHISEQLKNTHCKCRCVLVIQINNPCYYERKRELLI